MNNTSVRRRLYRGPSVGPLVERGQLITSVGQVTVGGGGRSGISQFFALSGVVLRALQAISGGFCGIFPR